MSTPVSLLTTTRRRRALLGLSAALVVAFLVLGASSAFAISRNTVLARAQKRVDSPVKYSQSKYYAGYRTDCSGYVSMCWSTGTSWNTRTFHKVTHRIPVTSLKPGDALLKKGYHIRLFYGWVDATRTQYIAYESASGKIAGTRIRSLADDLKAGYVPVRYDRITDSPAPRNILRNPTFNVWARQWSTASEQPAWWLVTGEWWQTLAVHRMDVYRTARNSLELRNPSDDPERYTEMSQTVPVTPGASYRLKAWAKSASDPAGLDLGVTYLDAAGASVAETRTTAAAWGVNDTSFTSMAVQMPAPANAVAARVSIRLASAVDTSTGSAIGASAIVDDISLYRPQVSVGIKASRATATKGKSVTLSGSVTPASAVGVPTSVYVKKPGGSWTRLSTAKVSAAGTSGAWKAKYTFKRGMRPGTYRFRTTVPAVPGYLGATSSTVSVKLK